MFFSLSRSSAPIALTSSLEVGDSSASIVAHYVVAVKPPAVPAPAATLVLLRDDPDEGVTVLLIQRHRASKFAAGDFVFPGGKIEADDDAPDAAACAGLDAREAARVLGLAESSHALGYWTGAIREAFEEVGVLLAYDADGRPAELPPARADVYRHACQTDSRAFWAMLREERLTLATDRLVYFAHWITPEEQPLRFDTRFFAAPAPAGQTPVADDHEIIAVRWLSPRAALDARERGEISLRTPTMKNLMLLDGAASVADVLRRLGERPVAAIRPRIVLDAAGAPLRALLPGDPGYW
jgi:8-oxo-dGTP pyrophosphatase MutT (NUDIX family)